MNRDQIKGRMNKEITGRIVSEKTLEGKGRIQPTIGKFKAGYDYFNDDLKKDHRPRKSRSFNHE